MSTEKRKQEHIERALEKESQYSKRNLFERIHFIHNALPEINFDDIDLSVNAFGKKFDMPLMIIGMTGGYSKAKEINIELAKNAELFNIPFGVGSQRAMIENPNLKETYDVKKEADVFLVGNIGAYQLKVYSREKIEELVKSIEANALAIHLNPLQEIVQPEGDRDWSNILMKIHEVVDYLDVPVIIKETGAGISREVVFKLSRIGVKWIDVSGSGGTSWSKIEYMRGGKIKGFEEWGIPTALSILMCRDMANIIASGGIRSGIDGAKAIALGASLFGAAKPFLDAHYSGKTKEKIEEWRDQLKTVLFLTGNKNIEEFKKNKPIYVDPYIERIATQLGLRI